MEYNNAILLFGNSDDRLDEIQKELSGKYYVKHASLLLGRKAELEEGLLPGVILIYLEKLSLTDYVVMNNLLRGPLRKVPIVVIGTSTETVVFENHVDCTKPLLLTLPVTNYDVMQAMRLYLEGAAQQNEDKKHILLVDDDRLTLRTIRGYLSADYRVTAMASGRDALQFLQKNKPDLILLDVMMPDMDGAQTLAAIRENDAARKIPVVFLSGSDDKATVVECLSLSPSAYLVKPIVKAKLLTELEHCLGGV